jgi:hypothetical protein
MQLLHNPTRDTLGRAASLTGPSEEELKSDRAANVLGGAAVLADIQGANRPAELNGWQEAVAEYGDTQLYAVEVYQTLKNGAAVGGSATKSRGDPVRIDRVASDPGRQINHVWLTGAAHKSRVVGRQVDR